MPTARIPKLSCHKASGQAVVCLNGKDHYLGRYGSATAEDKYDALIASCLTHGRQLPDPEIGLSVNDILLAYDKYAENYYHSDGTPNTELHCIRDALKVVKRVVGRNPAHKFGPKALMTVGQQMVEKGWCRTYINHQVDRVPRVFRWAVAEELLPGDIYHALQAVSACAEARLACENQNPLNQFQKL